jgi:hypothetical protein
MGVAHSKQSVVMLDSAGGTPTNISTYCNAQEPPRELDEVDVTTFGATSRQYISGFANGTVTMGGPWSRESDQFFSPLFAAFKNATIATASWEYGPEGNASGDVKYSGELVMLSYSGAKAAIDNAQEWEAEFRVTGDLTVGVY